MNSKDIEDVDDDLFISRRQQNYIFDETKDKISQRLMNSRALIHESEMAGQKAIEDLSVQREALERTEGNLDSINTMTRVTQKHINHMKSFFGGIGNLFSKSSKEIQPDIGESRGMPKSATVANFSANSYTANANAKVANDYGSPHTSVPNPSIPNQSGATSASSNNKPVDEYEANLDEIGFGLGRLKELAMKMGDEIEDHNEILDRITDKTERAGDSIKHQNRHMQQLLKK